MPLHESCPKLFDEIAQKIQSYIEKEGTFNRCGHIAMQSINEPDGKILYTGHYNVREGVSHIGIDETTGRPFDCCAIATMKIANAVAAYYNYNRTLLSGVIPVLAEYDAKDGYANYLGCILIIVTEKTGAKTIVAVSVSGSTQENDLKSAATAIEVIKKALDGEVLEIEAPERVQIDDASEACRIAKTCGKNTPDEANAALNRAFEEGDPIRSNGFFLGAFYAQLKNKPKT